MSDQQDTPVGLGALSGHWRRWRRALLGEAVGASFSFEPPSYTCRYRVFICVFFFSFSTRFPLAMAAGRSTSAPSSASCQNLGDLAKKYPMEDVLQVRPPPQSVTVFYLVVFF